MRGLWNHALEMLSRLQSFLTIFYDPSGHGPDILDPVAGFLHRFEGIFKKYLGEVLVRPRWVRVKGREWMGPPRR